MTEPIETSLTAEGNRAVGTTVATAKRDRLVISVLLVSTFVVILNETIMNVALPVLMRDLRISAGAAQWLSTSFMLTMAVVIPITGWLLQRFRTRQVYITAITLFSAGTLIAALAPGYTILLAARIIQASGTAIMFPLLITTVMTLVPPASRGRMMGNISIVIAVAPAIGPTISGLILSIFDWRWMFLFVLPIALVVLVVGSARMVDVTEPKSTHFDVFSVVVSAFGFGGLVYGLSNLGNIATGGSALVAWVPLAVGGVAIAVFILRQLRLQRRDDALLDLRTFTSRTFTAAIIMITISMLALFGTIILLPIYMQNVLGLDTLATGLLLLPGGLVMGLLAPLVGRIYDRIGPTALLITGSVLVSVVFWGMTLLDQNSSTWAVLAAHISLSLALALIFTPLFTAGLASLRQELYAHGSAIVGTIQQVAAAAGTALFVTVMATQAAIATVDGASEVVATASGVRAAFMTGAIISLFAIPVAAFVRKPLEESNGEPSAH